MIRFVENPEKFSSLVEVVEVEIVMRDGVDCWLVYNGCGELIWIVPRCIVVYGLW